MEDAIKPDAPQLYPVFSGNIVPGEMPIMPNHVQLGDVNAGFAEADEIVEGSTSLLSAQNPLPPEPPCIIAEWEGRKLTLSGSMSSPGLCQLYVAPATKSAPSDVRIIASCVGGSYGSKHLCGHIGPVLYAAALAKATRKPVGMFYTKEEHLSSFQVRMNCNAHFKIGIKKDGTVTAFQAEQLSDCGAYGTLQNFMVAVGIITFQNIIKCDNVEYFDKNILTNKTSSGAYRGFGYLETTALLTPILTMAMERVNIDPVEYYRKNVINNGDRFYHAYMHPGYEYSIGPDTSRVIVEGAKKFGWANRWKGWGKPTAIAGSKRRGVGIGVSGMADCGEQNSTATVELSYYGSATVHTNCTEFGPGTRDVMLKMAAETLNLPLELVNLTPPDSIANPWEWGSTGSRSTMAIGAAVVAAAKNAKQKLFEKAAPMFGATPEALETADGFVYLKDAPEGQRLPWVAIMGWQNSISAEGHFTARYDATVYQIQFTEVEVDVETGAVKILELLTCTDAGRVINPLPFKGQMDGFLPGVDLALREETIWDWNTGCIVNPNMIEYKTRTFNELPKHDYLILESFKDVDNEFPFGAFGAGEPSTSPAIPAVSMAIYNAIGKRFFDYPITPAKILKALGKG
jgi:xanthine dehydrogenase molybdenum-binding subunit